jgi:large subunit ribosomal protein L25
LNLHDKIWADRNNIKGKSNMANQTIKLTVNQRKLTGSKVKKLRRENIIPANIFGKGIKSQNIQVNQKDFITAYKQAGETSIIELNIEGSKTSNPVLVSNLHVHPATDSILHIDFHQVDLKEKVTATVPVELVGESPAVKELDGVLFSPVSELEVSALPMDIPNNIELDISTLVNIGDTLTLKDAKIDTSKLEFEIGPEEPIVIIQEQKIAEEEPEVVEETEESEGAEDSQEEKSDSDESKSSESGESDKPEAKETSSDKKED